MSDKYRNFAALERAEPPSAWRIRSRIRNKSNVLIIAPHGGGIEGRTSAIAELIARDSYNLYCFEGCKPTNNRDLHITSHRFDEPTALALAAHCATVIGVHGCGGTAAIFVGGLDGPLVNRLTDALRKAGFAASSKSHKFLATNANNICNRGSSGRGAQLEITQDLRMREGRRIASVVRAAIRQHIGKYTRRPPTSGITGPVLSRKD